MEPAELGLGSVALGPSESLESAGELGLGLVRMLELSSRESIISSKVGAMCVAFVSLASLCWAKCVAGRATVVGLFICF